MKSLHSYVVKVADCCAWVAALLVVLAPILVAADFGGVLPWTLWAASLAALVISVLVLIYSTINLPTGSAKAHSLSILLAAVAIYGFAQTLPLPQPILNIMAPGSAEAYSNWLSPLTLIPEDAEILNRHRPRVSVDASLTLTASWTTLLVAVFAALSSILFADRGRLRLLMIGLALAGSIHAGLGIVQMLNDPTATVWGIQSTQGGRPFGSFVNRSNAAVMLNIGLAGSIGLIAWRLAALTGATLNGDRFPFHELLDVVFDKISIFALTTASISITGLLVCGSRSGIAGVIGGLLLAFGLVQSANRARGVIPTLIGLALIAVIAIANFDLTALSTQRVSNTIEQVAETSQVADGRFDHWPDGFAAGMKQPLVGWGWGAYRYAYLPFQTTSDGGWFINADNLWLETFVESGLIGLIILSIGIYIVIRSLRQLDLGADPIDHGLASAGWFLLGALAASQFFDFGLRIPANSIAAALVFSAVIARCHARQWITTATNATMPNSRPSGFRLPYDIATAYPTKITTKANRFGFGTLLSIGLILISVSSVVAFNRRSLDDHAVRTARLVRTSDATNIASLTLAKGLLADATKLSSASTDSLVQSAMVDLLHARQQLASNVSQQTDSSTTDELVLVLTPSNLRKFSYLGTAPNETNESIQALETLWTTLGPTFPNHYQDLQSELGLARSIAVDALIRSPFSAEARLALVSLDFAGGSVDQSTELLKQAARLRSRNATLQLHIGDLAAEMRSNETVIASWKRAISLNPNLTQAVFNRTMNTSSATRNMVTPSSPGALTQALRIEAKAIKPDRILLVRGIHELSQFQPKTEAEQSSQYQLIAQCESALGKHKEAVESYEKAVELQPQNVQLRYEYTTALIKTNDLKAARESAQRGTALAPKDPRFKQSLETIARKNNKNS